MGEPENSKRAARSGEAPLDSEPEQAAAPSRPARPQARPGRLKRAVRARCIDAGLIATLLLAGIVVAYLALEGGAYDSLARNRVGILAWWAILAGVLVGALPLRRLNRLGWACLTLLAAFAAWSALSLTWTDSIERTAADLGRVTFLAGVFALALFTRTARAARRMAAAVGSAIAVFAAVALLARLQPDLFPTAAETAAFFDTTRLFFPINYWNGIATLIAIGVPLLLYTATSARHPLTAASAAAALPLMALAVYLTYSRGAMIAGFVGLAIFILFSYDRIPRIASLLAAAAGTAVLIAATSARTELADGLTQTRAAQTQGDEMLLITAAVCIAVGAIQAGITLALGKGVRPAWTRIPHNRARPASLAFAVAAFLTALAVNVPGHLTDAWDEFKASEPTGAGAERLSSFSGSNRYQLWEVATDQFSSAPLLGTGPGTYELWHNRLGEGGFVRDAHSLYIETLAELGAIGLALLAALILTILIGGTVATIRAPKDQRTQLAALLSACVVFALSAAADWTWELAVIPAVFFLLAAPLVTAGSSSAGRRRGGARPFAWRSRIAVAPVAIAATVALAIPLTTTALVRDSREAAAAGDLEQALAKARDAEAIMPSASTPHLQQALVYEAAGDLGPAQAAAIEAARNEPANWRPWLTLARIQAKRGQPRPAIRSYNRARTLNARSGIFPSR